MTLKNMNGIGHTVRLIGGPADGETRYVAAGDRIVVAGERSNATYQRDQRKMYIFRHLYDYPIQKERVDE
jgi:hypothetical protein